MQNRYISSNPPETEFKTKKSPLIHLLSIALARCFGSVLGTSLRLINCHKMSLNVYIFFLQTFMHLFLYLNIDIDFNEIKENKLVKYPRLQKGTIR